MEIKLILKLAFIALILPPYSTATSFDCSKAFFFSEKAICIDSELSTLDETLSNSYKNATKNSSDLATLKNDQLNWIKKSKSCMGDIVCLKSTYQTRIAELNNISLPKSEEIKITKTDPSSPRSNINSDQAPLFKPKQPDAETSTISQELIPIPELKAPDALEHIHELVKSNSIQSSTARGLIYSVVETLGTIVGDPDLPAHAISGYEVFWHMAVSYRLN